MAKRSRPSFLIFIVGERSLPFADGKERNKGGGGHYRMKCLGKTMMATIASHAN